MSRVRLSPADPARPVRPAATSTGMPFRTGVARERVDQQLVGQQVGVHAGVAARDAELDAGQVVAPPVGEAHRRRADASVTSTGSVTGPTRDADLGPAVARGRGGSRRRGGRAACSAACPSPAPRRCASTSCSTAGRAGRPARARRRRAPCERGRQAGDVGDDRLAARARSCPTACAARRAAGLERAEVDAVRVRRGAASSVSPSGRRRTRRRRDRCAA